MQSPGSAQNPLWCKDAIIFELHVRAYYDSNNDGIGGFPGLLHWMRHRVALRKFFQVFSRGSMECLRPANRKVLA